MTEDHRKLPRRRGEELNAAIYQAVLAELAEVGYAKLTMERVAERARTGKAALYRRWSSRMELAVDAVYHALPDPASPPDTGSFRGDLLALLRRSAELLTGPAGEALRGLLGDVLRDPERTAELRRLSQGNGRKAMREITRRAVERGEVDGDSVTPRRLEVPQAMLRQHFLFNGVPVPDDVIVGIVDEVVVPLFRV
ncbi:TetR/AcrR family transcriptional regulator [Actinosynnema sp. NPDC050801]|uniref:TetR/AcrR family transcriptional regulator n=1 Tax=unclassified Actinosynnema TaxID=2637065 RepID=UPI0033C0A0F7